jgi:hypothetical protein
LVLFRHYNTRKQVINYPFPTPPRRKKREKAMTVVPSSSFQQRGAVAKLMLGWIMLLSMVVTVQGFVPLAATVPRITTTTSLLQQQGDDDDDDDDEQPLAVLSRRGVLEKTLSVVAASSLLVLTPNVSPALARLEAVNRPDLLPPITTNVIQTEKFLTPGQARRMNDLLIALERDTGFRLRVLCQAYPNTPGLAIKEYWSVGGIDGQKDDKYIVLVVDQFGGKSNILNFNVGDGVKFALPNIFWTRLSAKYGTVRVCVCVGGDGFRTTSV